MLSIARSLVSSLGLQRAKAAEPPAAGAEVPDALHDQYVIQSLPHALESDPVKRELFRALATDYRVRHGGPPFDTIRIVQLMYLLDIANQAPDGDYIELGTHQGLTARIIWKLMDPARRLYLLDTFEGFVEQDLEVERKIYANNWTVGNFSPATPEEVCRYVGGGQCPANVNAIKGWFPGTFSGLENHRWRFVHIDFDLHAPIKAALELCWPRLLPGGVVVIHDYGCLGFPGAKIAVDEFFQKIGMVPHHLGDRWGSVAVIKPRTADPIC